MITKLFCHHNLQTHGPNKWYMVCAKLLYIGQSACRDMAASVLLDGCNETFIANEMESMQFGIPGEKYS